MYTRGFDYETGSLQEDDFADPTLYRVPNKRKSEPQPVAIDRALIFQPNTEVDFPTTLIGRKKIPHIIHIVYQDNDIPYVFVDLLRSFYEQNPKWEFRFWSFETGRKLIEMRYPYLLKAFVNLKDTETDNEKKSDMIRFVALYEYGGFSANLDVLNVRPLDRATNKYSCIIPTEPFEQAAILNTFEVILSPSIMLCRSGHPFFRLLVGSLTEIDAENTLFYATGGGQLTRIFLKYNNLTTNDIRRTKTDNSSNSPFFYKGRLNEADEKALYIPNTQYFTDTINPSLLNKFGELKDCAASDRLRDYLAERACAEFAIRKEIRNNRKYLFTSRTYMSVWEKHYTRNVVDIKKIIPNIIFYE